MTENTTLSQMIAGIADESGVSGVTYRNVQPAVSSDMTDQEDEPPVSASQHRRMDRQLGFLTEQLWSSFSVEEFLIPPSQEQILDSIVSWDTDYRPTGTLASSVGSDMEPPEPDPPFLGLVSQSQAEIVPANVDSVTLSLVSKQQADLQPSVCQSKADLVAFNFVNQSHAGQACSGKQSEAELEPSSVEPQSQLTDQTSVDASKPGDHSSHTNNSTKESSSSSAGVISPSPEAATVVRPMLPPFSQLAPRARIYCGGGDSHGENGMSDFSSIGHEPSMIEGSSSDRYHLESDCSIIGAPTYHSTQKDAAFHSTQKGAVFSFSNPTYHSTQKDAVLPSSENDAVISFGVPIYHSTQKDAMLPSLSEGLNTQECQQMESQDYSHGSCFDLSPKKCDGTSLGSDHVQDDIHNTPHANDRPNLCSNINSSDKCIDQNDRIPKTTSAEKMNVEDKNNLQTLEHKAREVIVNMTRTVRTDSDLSDVLPVISGNADIAAQAREVETDSKDLQEPDRQSKQHDEEHMSDEVIVISSSDLEVSKSKSVSVTFCREEQDEGGDNDAEVIDGEDRNESNEQLEHDLREDEFQGQKLNSTAESENVAGTELPSQTHLKATSVDTNDCEIDKGRETNKDIGSRKIGFLMKNGSQLLNFSVERDTVDKIYSAESKPSTSTSKAPQKVIEYLDSTYPDTMSTTCMSTGSLQLTMESMEELTTESQALRQLQNLEGLNMTDVRNMKGDITGSLVLSKDSLLLCDTQGKFGENGHGETFVDEEGDDDDDDDGGGDADVDENVEKELNNEEDYTLKETNDSSFLKKLQSQQVIDKTAVESPSAIKPEIVSNDNNDLGSKTMTDSAKVQNMKSSSESSLETSKEPERIKPQGKNPKLFWASCEKELKLLLEGNVGACFDFESKSPKRSCTLRRKVQQAREVDKHNQVLVDHVKQFTEQRDSGKKKDIEQIYSSVCNSTGVVNRTRNAMKRKRDLDDLAHLEEHVKETMEIWMSPGPSKVNTGENNNKRSTGGLSVVSLSDSDSLEEGKHTPPRRKQIKTQDEQSSITGSDLDTSIDVTSRGQGRQQYKSLRLKLKRLPYLYMERIESSSLRKKLTMQGYVCSAYRPRLARLVAVAQTPVRNLTVRSRLFDSPLPDQRRDLEPCMHHSPVNLPASSSVPSPVTSAEKMKVILCQANKANKEDSVTESSVINRVHEHTGGLTKQLSKAGVSTKDVSMSPQSSIPPALEKSVNTSDRDISYNVQSSNDSQVSSTTDDGGEQPVTEFVEQVAESSSSESCVKTPSFGSVSSSGEMDSTGKFEYASTQGFSLHEGLNINQKKDSVFDKSMKYVGVSDNIKKLCHESEGFCPIMLDESLVGLGDCTIMAVSNQVINFDASVTGGPKPFPAVGKKVAEMAEDDVIVVSSSGGDSTVNSSLENSESNGPQKAGISDTNITSKLTGKIQTVKSLSNVTQHADKDHGDDVVIVDDDVEDSGWLTSSKTKSTSKRPPVERMPSKESIESDEFMDNLGNYRRKQETIEKGAHVKVNKAQKQPATQKKKTGVQSGSSGCGNILKYLKPVSELNQAENKTNKSKQSSSVTSSAAVRSKTYSDSRHTEDLRKATRNTELVNNETRSSGNMGRAIKIVEQTAPKQRGENKLKRKKHVKEFKYEEVTVQGSTADMRSMEQVERLNSVLDEVKLSDKDRNKKLNDQNLNKNKHAESKMIEKVKPGSKDSSSNKDIVVSKIQNSPRTGDKHSKLSINECRNTKSGSIDSGSKDRSSKSPKGNIESPITSSDKSQRSESKKRTGSSTKIVGILSLNETLAKESRHLPKSPYKGQSDRYGSPKVGLNTSKSLSITRKHFEKASMRKSLFNDTKVADLGKNVSSSSSLSDPSQSLLGPQTKKKPLEFESNPSARSPAKAKNRTLGQVKNLDQQMAGTSENLWSEPMSMLDSYIPSQEFLEDEELYKQESKNPDKTIKAVKDIMKGKSPIKTSDVASDKSGISTIMYRTAKNLVSSPKSSLNSPSGRHSRKNKAPVSDMEGLPLKRIAIDRGSDSDTSQKKVKSSKRLDQASSSGASSTTKPANKDSSDDYLHSSWKDTLSFIDKYIPQLPRSSSERSVKSSNETLNNPRKSNCETVNEPNKRCGVSDVKSVHGDVSVKDDNPVQYSEDWRSSELDSVDKMLLETIHSSSST